MDDETITLREYGGHVDLFTCWKKTDVETGDVTWEHSPLCGGIICKYLLGELP